MSDFLNFSLEGKVALVTGASYGIGYAIASAYAKSGAKIVFCDIKQEFVDKGLASYMADGIDAKGYVCDVTNEEMVQDMVKKIEAEVGVIDILVNNAGIIKRIPMCDMTADEFFSAPPDCQMSSSISCCRARVMASSAPNGSSMSSMGEFIASARAIAARWRMPPESSPGSFLPHPAKPTMVRYSSAICRRSARDSPGRVCSNASARLSVQLLHGKRL